MLGFQNSLSILYLLIAVCGWCQENGQFYFDERPGSKRSPIIIYEYEKDSLFHFRSPSGVSDSCAKVDWQHFKALLVKPKSIPGLGTSPFTKMFISGDKPLTLRFHGPIAAFELEVRKRDFWVSAGVSVFGFKGFPIYGLNAGYYAPYPGRLDLKVGFSVSHLNLYFPQLDFDGVDLLQIGITQGDALKSHHFAFAGLSVPQLDFQSWGFRYVYSTKHKHKKGKNVEVWVLPGSELWFIMYAHTWRYHGKHIYLDYGYVINSSPIPMYPYFGAAYQFKLPMKKERLY